MCGVVGSISRRQTRKRLATRQRISDVASRLFFERGFDEVTIEEIAEAADVSRMTVFNHFSRKEDLLFDLDDEGRRELLAALEHRSSSTSPLEALRLFAHWAVANERPYVRFDASGTDRFMATIQASEALKARARGIRDELTDTLATALAKSTNSPLPDSAASLGASLLVATWTVALVESHRVFQLDSDMKEANIVFLGIVDQGTRGVHAALQGTPYI